MIRWRTVLVGLTVTAALAVGGCGDDDSGDTAGGVTQTGTGIAQISFDEQTYAFDDVTCAVDDTGATTIDATGDGPEGAASLAITVAAERAEEDTFSAEDMALEFTTAGGTVLVSDGTRMSVFPATEGDTSRWVGTFLSDPEASTPAEVSSASLVVNCP